MTSSSPPLGAKVDDFLAQKRIAVAGVSRDNSRHPVGNLIYHRLKDTGHEVFPVNPNMEMFEGTRCYPDLRSIPGGVDANRRFPVAMTYPDAARVSVNEDVVLFLSNDDLVPGAYAVTGSQLGKLSIVEGEAGERLVSRDNIGGKVKAAPGLVRGNLSFVPEGAFKQKVREYAN